MKIEYATQQTHNASLSDNVRPNIRAGLRIIMIIEAAMTAKTPRDICTPMLITPGPRNAASQAEPGTNVKSLVLLDKSGPTDVACETTLAAPAPLPRERFEGTNDCAEHEQCQEQVEQIAAKVRVE
jgi:hypothetical protein